MPHKLSSFAGSLRAVRPPRRIVALAVAGALGLGDVPGSLAVELEAGVPARPRVKAELGPVVMDAPPLEAIPIGPELRARGYHACNPPEPIGLGPYHELLNLSMGRIAIPQRGGHTEDMGYDVLIHFHGGAPMRKTLVQVARGVTFAIIDKGVGSGPYASAFNAPDSFRALRRSIEHALRRRSGDSRAHIRHLALSSWSAGYGAINEILKHGDAGIDAVVLLDSLHASWSPTHRRDGSVRSVSRDYVAPIMDYARRAARGEKLFILTHSDITPPSYPSVKLSADLLLDELGLVRTPVDRDAGLLWQDGVARMGNLHVWSYRGKDELAHCGHLSLIAPAVRDVIEPAWQTPPLDRGVPLTPAPKLGP